MTRNSLTRISCTIDDDLLTELDEACWQNRMNRSKFVCEAVAAYIKKLDKAKMNKSEFNDE